MPTLMDIAAALGINKTTVSKALNHSSDISAETRERVIAEAKRIGYIQRPRKKAQGKAENLIGVICPEITSTYYAEIVTHLSACLERKGYNTIILLSNFSMDAEQKLLAQLVKLRVAGIVMVTESSNLEPIIQAVPGAKTIPTMIMGLNYKSKAHDVVSVDEEFGIASVVEYLASMGVEHVAFIGDHFVDKRLKYLKKYLDRSGMKMPEKYVILSEQRNEACGYEGMKKLLALPDIPQTVLTGYDAIALGAYRAITERGLRVPEDVALVGFDDAPFCRYLPDSLTTVNCDIAAQCQVATAVLLNHIQSTPNAHEYTQTVAVTPKLVIRESTPAQKL